MGISCSTVDEDSVGMTKRSQNGEWARDGAQGGNQSWPIGVDELTMRLCHGLYMLGFPRPPRQQLRFFKRDPRRQPPILNTLVAEIQHNG